MSNFPPQVRFNWGFWDAIADAENQRFNRANLHSYGAQRQAPLPQGKDYASYRAGYSAGWSHWQESKAAPETSQAAWDAYSGASW